MAAGRAYLDALDDKTNLYRERYQAVYRNTIKATDALESPLPTSEEMANRYESLSILPGYARSAEAGWADCMRNVAKQLRGSHEEGTLRIAASTDGVRDLAKMEALDTAAAELDRQADELEARK